MAARLLPCPSCGRVNTVGSSDPHARCIQCLGVDHDFTSCGMCRSLPSRTRRQRSAIFRVWRHLRTPECPSQREVKCLLATPSFYEELVAEGLGSAVTSHRSTASAPPTAGGRSAPFPGPPLPSALPRPSAPRSAPVGFPLQANLDAPALPLGVSWAAFSEARARAAASAPLPAPSAPPVTVTATSVPVGPRSFGDVGLGGQSAQPPTLGSEAQAPQVGGVPPTSEVVAPPQAVAAPASAASQPGPVPAVGSSLWGPGSTPPEISQMREQAQAQQLERTQDLVQSMLASALAPLQSSHS